MAPSLPVRRLGRRPNAPPGGLERWQTIISASPWPCVAMGGITPDRVGALSASGVAGIAVISAICGQPDVTAAARGLRAAWDPKPPPTP